ncbi:hypothetical protein ACF0H5_020668 [Mactra antiquata]
MRACFRIRRNVRKPLLVATIALWCAAFYFYSSVSVSSKQFSTVQRKTFPKVFSPQRNGMVINYSGSDSNRGQFSVIDALLNKTTRGVFVEIGNEMNETGSLTYMFEKSRDWTGLQIVPGKDSLHEVLNAGRKAKLVQACLKFTDREWPHAGIPDAPCIVPDDFRDLAETNKVDMLVLDLEGNEIDFLRVFPFDKITVAMVTFEIHGTSTDDLEIFTVMEKQNFECVHIMVNRLYNKSDVIFRNKGR